MNDELDHGTRQTSSRVVQKRKRIPLACSVCRDRKTRCDSQLPCCSSCVRKGLEEECIYEEGANKSQRYVKELEDKIKRLEAQKADGSPSAGLIPRGNSQELNPASNSRIPNDSTGNGVDALATVPSPGKYTGHYGDSSTIAFISQVLNATSPEQQPTSPVAGPTHSDLSGLGPQRSVEPREFLLPPRRTADNFLGCYWEFIHPLFPVLHKPTFLSVYARLWEPSPQTNLSQDDEVHNMVFHSILNITFALGSQFSSTVTPGKKITSASEFYQRSRRLLSFEILDAGHLQLVQALLLTGVYLQSTKLANRCWNVVGLAIRVAYSLGLHTNYTAEKVTQVEVEMRRRIWHTCVMLDRLLAMTFGRPTTIPRTWTTNNPSLIDDEYLSRTAVGVQPQDIPSHLSLFIYSLALFDILEDVLSTFYLKDRGEFHLQDASLESWSIERSVEVFKLNSKLEDFQSNLPVYLHPASSHLSPGFNDNKYMTLQTRVLNSRFLYIRILLLRPVILAVAQDKISRTKPSPQSSSLSLSQDMSSSMCVLCVQTAHELIAQMHENLNDNYRSSAWHTVYFTFAAATVLVFSHLNTLKIPQPNEKSFETSWLKCISILEHHREQVQSASQAISTLQDLRLRVSLRFVQSQGNQHTQSLGAAGPRSNDLQFFDAPPEVDYNQGFADSTLVQNSELDMMNLSDIDLEWFHQQCVQADWLQMSNDQQPFYL